MNQVAASQPSRGTSLGHEGSAKSVQELVDEAQVEFGCGVGLDDIHLRAVAYSRQPEEIDDVRRESILRRVTSPSVAQWLRECGIWEADRALRTPANEKLGMRGRLCVPIRWERGLLGFLWIVDSPDLGEEKVEAAILYAERIAAALAHERFLEQRDRELEADCVRHLLRGDSPPLGLPARLTRSRDFYVAVLLFSDSDSSLSREAAEAELRKSFGDFRRRLALRPVIFAVENGEGWFVVGRGAGGDAEVREDFEDLRSSLPDSSVRVGISEPREGLGDLASALREARWSAEAAGAIAPSGCVTWASLGASRTLFKLLGGRDSEHLIPAGLIRLRDAEGGKTLLATLQTYLEAGCDSKATSAAFSIHRSTLYQRLRRIEEVSGLSLKDGDDRLILHIGVRLLQLGVAKGSGR